MSATKHLIGNNYLLNDKDKKPQSNLNTFRKYAPSNTSSTQQASSNDSNRINYKLVNSLNINHISTNKVKTVKSSPKKD